MDSYQSLLNYSPYLILGFLLLAGGFLMKILFAYTSIVYRTQMMKQAIAGPLSVFKGREQEAAAAAQDDQQAIKPGSLSYYWNRLLIVLHIRKEDDEVTLSFQKALHTLKTHFGAQEYKYRLPWYLLIGAENSGKSRLIEDLELDLPVGAPEMDPNYPNENTKWWLFDRGVIIDVKGGYILNEDSQENDNFGWSKLLALLSRYRNRRPLDGVILTLPIDELYGKDAASEEAILERAKIIHAKLWHLQKSLAMRVPVYVTITKTDLVPGFREFCAELPANSLKEMLGWSASYSLEDTFNPSWLDTARDNILRSLNETRSEIYEAGIVRENRDGAMLFKVELEKCFDNIKTYLSHIFRESTFHESFFLRGLYFTGDVGNHTAVGEHRRSEKYWTPPEALGAAIDVPFESEDRYRIGFVRDLIEKKVFSEYGLANPINRILRSTNRWLNFSKAVAAILVVVWGVGLYKDNARLQEGKRSLMPFIEEVDQTLFNMKRKGFELSRMEDAHYLNEQTIKILQAMTKVDINNTFSYYVPASWFGSYDRHLQQSFTIAWDQIVLRSMFTGLQEKARNLFLTIKSAKDDEDSSLNPVDKPAYLTLSEYVDGTEKFERNVTLFNNLENSENIDDVGRIILYLFEIDLPETFYQNANYYRGALSRTLDRNIDISEFSAAASRKLALLYDQFLKQAFDPEKSSINHEELIRSVENLRQRSTNLGFNQESIYKDISFILDVAKSINDESFKWIEKNEFNPSPLYTRMLNQIASSRLLGVEEANRISKVTQVRFDEYKQALKELRAPLIGRIFGVEDNNLLARPSDPYVALVRNLGEFLKEPFMAPLKNPQAIATIPPGQSMFWEETALDRAAALTDAYSKYLAEKATILSNEVKSIFINLGRYSLNQHIFNAIAKAQSFRPIPKSVTGYTEQEALQQQVQNLRDVQGYFSQILGPQLVGDFSQQASKLRTVLGDYAYGMLTRIDHILMREDLYGVGKDTFNWWEGSDMLAFAAFGVYDIEGMKSYLSAQRDRVTFLTSDLAAPVLGFLELDYLKKLHRNDRLIDKWNRMALQVDAFGKQLPGNSVGVLEQFIMFDLNQVSYETCYDTINLAEPFTPTGDYFLDKRSQIRMAMVDRCENLLKMRGVETYNKLAQFFNAHMAGKFPFNKEGDDAAYGEVSSSDAETFLALFDKLGPVERQSIGEYFAYTGSKESPADFIRQMETIQPLLQAAIDGNFGMHIPKIDFSVEFRTDRNKEQGGEKVIDWGMEVNGIEVDFWDKNRAGEWHLGDDVAVIFKWAANGNIVPASDPLNPELTIEGDVARYTYSGRWSLVKLLKTHTINVSRLNQSTPIVLEFKIPTNPRGYVDPAGAQPATDGLAKLFLHFNMKVPMPAGTEEEPTKIVQKEIPVPIFPTHAPVITKGQVVR